MYGNSLWGYWYNQRIPVNERELRIIAASLAKMTGIKIVRTDNPVWSVNVDTKVMSIPKGDLYDEDIGFLIHESAHLRFSSSDKQFMVKLMEIIKPLKKDPEQIWLLIQVLEDIRVNHKIEQLYRGAKKFIDRTYSIKSDEYISDLRQMLYTRNSYELRMYMSNMRHLQFLKLLTLYPRKLASYIRQLENQFTHRSVKSAIDKSLKIVNEIPAINDTMDLFEPFKKILKHYLPFCKDVQDDPQGGGQQDNQQENQQNQQVNIQAEGQGQDKQQQDNQQGDQQSQQGQGNQQDNQKQDKEKQLDDVVKNIIQAMNESQQRRESGELSDSPKNDIEPNSKQDEQDKEDGDSSSQGGGGMGKDNRDREVKIGYGEERREQKEKESKPINLDDLTDFYNKMEKGWVTPYEDFTLEELLKAIGENLAPMRKSVSVLKDLSFERYEGNYQSGKLQNRRLYKLQVKKTNIFTKKIVDMATERDMAIAILVDESGSMKGRQSVCACIASSVLGKALEMAGRPFMMCGFNEDFYVHKNWKERMNYLKMLDVVKNTSGNGSGKTNDAYAIHKVTEMMRKVSERNKVLIVLSDGSPNPSYGKDENGVRYSSFDLKDEVLLSERSGVKIYSIGIMDNAVEKYYPRWKEINSLDELAPELKKIFVENVGKRIR